MQSRDNICFTCWLDVSLNAFPKLLFDWRAGKFQRCSPEVNKDRSKCIRQHTAIMERQLRGLPNNEKTALFLWVFESWDLIWSSDQISIRLCTSSQPQVCPRPTMLNCKLSTNTSSSHNAQRSWFIQKMRSSFCSWVCLRSDRILTTNKPLQGSFESELFKEVSVHLFGPLLVRTRVRLLHLTCPNEEGKRTLVWFNRTKWCRCESTLRLHAK